MSKMRGSVEDKIQSIRSDSILDKRKNSENAKSDSDATIIKEGYMDKESSSKLFQWRPKYCILSSEYLTIYRWHSKKTSGSHEKLKNILFRFPLDDVTAMSNIMKRRRYVFFTICTKEGSLDLRVTTDDRDWLSKIQIAVLERKSRIEFVRELKSRTNLFASRKRRNNVRRRSFKKDPKYGDGIGITIKNEGECVIIARVFEESPAAKKGTVNVGDEIISVDGIDVYGKHAEDVAELIKSRSNLVVLTVKPAEKSQSNVNCRVSVGVQSENRHHRACTEKLVEQIKLRHVVANLDEGDENKDPKDERPNEVISDEIDVHAPPTNLETTTKGVLGSKEQPKGGQCASETTERSLVV
ncbi:uncharacterized protein [Apostichopus japonicus]|uniref:uncharacterized protein n=1 Tax=Stichopus japonicus TaxID=307972 RepID=UPI003AB838E0